MNVKRKLGKTVRWAVDEAVYSAIHSAVYSAVDRAVHRHWAVKDIDDAVGLVVEDAISRAVRAAIRNEQ